MTPCTRFLASLLVLVAIASTQAQRCPDKPGFITKPDTNWAVNSKTQDGQARPAANAEQICNLDLNCMAFNNAGYYLFSKVPNVQPTIAATGVQLSQYSGLCTYIKASALGPAPCPDKPGYITKVDTNWVAGANAQESQTQPGNAQQICNLDSNCLAFNSYGYYVLRKGSVAPTLAAAGVRLQPYNGLCTYIRQSAFQEQQQAIPQSVPMQPSSQPTSQQQVQVIVLRNAATKLCLTANDAERPLLGISRLAQAPCSPRDTSQAFRSVQVSNIGYQIVDTKGRCVTSFQGLLVDSVAMVACGRNRADQLWSLNGSARGMYAIKGREANKCIVSGRSRLLSLDACNASDDALFEAAPWL